FSLAFAAVLGAAFATGLAAGLAEAAAFAAVRFASAGFAAFSLTVAFLLAVADFFAGVLATCSSSGDGVLPSRVAVMSIVYLWRHALRAQASCPPAYCP